MQSRKKVVVGLSGGVDSSVAAALLLEQGYEVHGVYLECYNEPGCRTDQDKADALKVAIQLGITFQVLDFRKEYKDRVIEYFYREYGAGRTPNPDIMCNREIKFGIFYDWAMKQGYDYVATGHYSRIIEGRLQSARDATKDQSYFLWQVPRDHLAHILFPLGNMLKSVVRQKAKALGLPTATKPDSMGICFIGDVDVAKLLRDRLGEKPGKVVMGDEVVGMHHGLWFYTIGSRGGWNLLPTYQNPQMPPLYVIGKNQAKNELVVGTRDQTMRSSFRLHELSLEEASGLCVRIRNLGDCYPVANIAGETVTTNEPLFGLAEGQSAVFYDSQGIVRGGGTIAN